MATKKRTISQVFGGKQNGFRDPIGVKVGDQELLTGRQKTGTAVKDLPFAIQNVRRRFGIDDGISRGQLAAKPPVEEEVKRLRQRRGGGARSLLSNQRLADVLGG